MMRALAVAVLLLAACSTGPRQEVRCYQDPTEPGRCEPQRHYGWTVVYWPMFYRGNYYSSTGLRTSPPPIGTIDYVEARRRSVGTSFSENGTPARSPRAARATTRPTTRATTSRPYRAPVRPPIRVRP